MQTGILLPWVHLILQPSPFCSLASVIAKLVVLRTRSMLAPPLRRGSAKKVYRRGGFLASIAVTAGVR